jgi:hypothetical protein
MDFWISRILEFWIYGFIDFFIYGFLIFWGGGGLEKAYGFNIKIKQPKPEWWGTTITVTQPSTTNMYATSTWTTSTTAMTSSVVEHNGLVVTVVVGCLAHSVLLLLATALTGIAC